MRDSFALRGFIVLLLSTTLPCAADEPPAPPDAPNLDPIVQLLAAVDDPAVQADVLRGLQAALKDRRQVAAPAGWAAAAGRLAKSPSADVRQRARLLSLQFGDPGALEALRAVAGDRSAEPAERQDAIQALARNNAPGLAPLLHGLLGEPAMAGPALRALAACGDGATPQAILGRYKTFDENDRRDALNTLASRPGPALAMLRAVEQGALPRGDLTALTVRQLGALGDKGVDEAVKKLWGAVRPASEEKVELMKTYKGRLTPEALKQADLPNGRLVFSRTCAACHTLFDEGGKVGPNLTGSQRANLDYVLENVLDPSAVVAREYLMTWVRTKDGRVVTGIIEEDSANALTLKMPGESVVVPKNEIKVRKTESISMMPEGLLGALSENDARDLVAYLASPAQVGGKGGGG